MKPFFTVLATVVGLVLAPLCRAGEEQIVNVTVPKADKVAIRVPGSWKQTVTQPRQDLPPTVTVTSAADAISLQLTFIADMKGNFATKDGVDRVVTAANQQYVSGSVEKSLSLIQFDSASGYGCYSEFTDADLARLEALPAGQFRHVSSGVFVIGKQAVAFTLLTNSTNEPAYRQALQIVSAGISIQ